MPNSETTAWRGSAPILVSLGRGLAVACVCAIAYGLLIALLTVLKVGGAPLIGRTVPIKETGGLGFSLPRFREADQSGPVDIVILGASQAFCSFDPRWIKTQGYTSQSLGSVAQTPSHTVSLIHRYADRLKPKLAILVVSQQALALEGLESFADLAGNLPLDRHILGMAAESPGINSANVIVAATLQHFFQPLATTQQKVIPFQTYIPGGYVENTSPFKGREHWNAFQLPILYEQLRSTQDVILNLRAKNITCVAISVPITPHAKSRILNYLENEKLLTQMSEQAGAPYKDFNDDLHLAPPEDFADELHLNPTGVAKTQTAVFDWIKTKGLLPPPSTH